MGVNYAEYPVLNIIAQAMSGNMSITGPPHSKPYRSDIPIANIAGSMYAVQDVLGALFRRERSGEGQYIDISMLDCMISWLTVKFGYTFATDDRTAAREPGQTRVDSGGQTDRTADRRVVRRDDRPRRSERSDLRYEGSLGRRARETLRTALRETDGR